MNNPMKGLFLLTYFRTRNALLASIGGVFIIGLAFLATEQELLYNMFVILCMIHLPVQALGGMGGTEGRWERFQVSLPVKRSDLLKVQYLSVVLVAIIGAVILTAGIGISTAVHREWFNYGFASAIASSSHSYGLALMAIGLAFILGTVLPHHIAGIVAFMVPALTQALVPVIADNTEISIYVASVSVLVVSVVVFIASYFIMKGAYGKVDF